MKTSLHVLIIILLVVIIFIEIIPRNNNNECDEIYQYYKMQEGNFVIDTLYVDVGIHERVMQNHDKGKLDYFIDLFVIQPKVGDSIYKQKGNFEYVLVTKDSTYVQSWKCETGTPLLIDRWKNTEKH